jgi:hypothetical protein
VNYGPNRISGLALPVPRFQSLSAFDEHGQQEPENLMNILLHDYAVAAKHFAWAVCELNCQRAVLPIAHYEKLYRVVEDAREDCERLRKALADLETK